MKNRVDEGTIMEQRILKKLRSIKKLIEINPHAGIYSSKTKECVIALRSLGVLTNYGNNIRPVYSWQEGVAVSESLANKVTAIIRKRASERYEKHRKILDEKKENIVNEPVEVINDLFMSDSTNMPAFSISDFSSQELWDELKNRGFSIVNDSIQKVEVTTLV